MKDVTAQYERPRFLKRALMMQRLLFFIHAPGHECVTCNSYTSYITIYSI